MTTEIEKTKEIAIILILFGLAILTRIYGLGEWSLRADEYYTYHEAFQRFRTFVNPSYYALTALSINLFGLSEFSVRLPAFLLGILAVPVFYILARNVIGRNAAIFAAVLILFSSWHLHYSQAARFYSGVFLFSTIAYMCFYLALKKDSIKYLLVALISGLIAASFHATAVVFFASVALFSMITLIWKDIGDYSRRIAIIYLVMCLVIGLAISPFVLKIILYWSSSEQVWGYGPIKFALQTVKYIQVPVAISAIFAVFYLYRENRLLAVYFLVVVLTPLLLLMGLAKFSSVRPDYLFHALPVVFALAGLLIEKYRVAMKEYGITSYAMVVLVVVSMLPEYASYYMDKASLDVKDAIRFISRSYQPGDKIYTTIGGFDTYGPVISPGTRFEFAKRIGGVNNNKADWENKLRQYEKPGTCVWFFLPVNRNHLAPKLENWLFRHARLVWRKHSNRLDYSYNGYEIFLTNTCDRR